MHITSSFAPAATSVRQPGPAPVFGAGKSAEKKRFHRPTPNRGLMHSMGLLNNWFLLKGQPILRHIPLVNNIPLIGGYFKVATVDLPTQDEAMFRNAVNPDTAAFIAPNHPEFMTDWLIDKYISGKFAPEMASWAAASIVNSPNKWIRNFWLSNNIVSNDGGEAGKQYSIESALSGRHVLLHPEGTVRWTGNKVNQLMPGVVEMAVEAAAQSLDEELSRPVYIAPLVWKLRFNQDVSGGLTDEIAELEEKLHLPPNKNASLATRFYLLQQNILTDQMRRLGFDDLAKEKPGAYFDRAEAFLNALYEDVHSRYAIKQDGTMDQRIHRLFKAVSDERKTLKKSGRQDAELAQRLKLDTKKIQEMKRLRCFTRDLYGGPVISQEEIAETLKLNRQMLIGGGYEEVRALMPRPVGWRTAHIRAVMPIDVTERLRAARSKGISEEVLTGQLLDEVHAAMQQRLNKLLREIEPDLKARRHNPFHNKQPLK